MTTLHGYILRELAKTFALTIIAMGTLFTLAGGLYNVIEFEGVSARDLWAVLPMLMPVVITLTMPIAAIFATTMTYGRLAADNELVACRAAGINVHKLFLGAILLSIFVSLFTAASVNFVIPGFLKRIEYFIRTNVDDMAYERLRQRGYIHYVGRGDNARLTLTAQRVWIPDENDLTTRGYEPPGGGVSYFWVERPTFLRIDRDARIEQFSVAEGGLVKFDTRGERVQVSFYISDARNLEPGPPQRVDRVSRQKIGPIEAPLRFPLKPSMINLRELFAWRDAPWLAPDVAQAVEKFLTPLRALELYENAAELLAAGEPLQLTDRQATRYTLSAAEVIPGARELLLRDVRVRATDQAGGRPLEYEAPSAELLATPTDAPDADGPTTPRLVLKLKLLNTPDRPVREYHPRGDDRGSARERDAVHFDDLRAGPELADRLADYSPRAVLAPDFSFPAADILGPQHSAAVEEAQSLQRKVVALIHSRLGFATSAIVTVLMGAILGVIFRGARALAAFGLACVPFAVTGILILMGRQLTNSENTHDVGPVVTWAGLAGVGLLNLIVMYLGVRR